MAALKFSGSPVFLKNKFGVGYHIVLTKSDNYNAAQVDELIRSHVPEARFENVSGAEVSFVLPFHASSKFSKLFKDLDLQAEDLGISGYGAVVTSMEEVFLRVTQDGWTAMHLVSRKLNDARASVRSSRVGRSSSAQSHNAQQLASDGKELVTVPATLNTGANLWLQQFYALLVKKMLHSKRNYKVTIGQALVPMYFVILTIISILYPPFQAKNVFFDLALDAYGPNIVYLNIQKNTSFGNAYKNQFEGTEVTSYPYQGGVDDFEMFLAGIFEQQGGDFNTKYLVSASFNEAGNSSHAIAWFNNQAYHTPATSIAYVDQAYLRYATNRNFSITYVNNPLPGNSINQIKDQLAGSASGLFIGFYVVLGFSYLSASFSVFLVRERIDRSSLLQALAGVEPLCFWMSTFAWDVINFMIPCFLCMIMFAVFSMSEFTEHAGVVILLFLFYCFASLPLVYLLSFLFSEPSTALVSITSFNVITGSVSIITANICRLLQLPDVADKLHWFFLLAPPYCLGTGVAEVYRNDKLVKACTEDILTSSTCEVLEKNLERKRHEEKL